MIDPLVAVGRRRQNCVRLAVPGNQERADVLPVPVGDKLDLAGVEFPAADRPQDFPRIGEVRSLFGQAETAAGNAEIIADLAQRVNRRRLVFVLGAADEGQIGNQVPQELAEGIGDQEFLGSGKFRKIFSGALFLGMEKGEIGAAEAIDFRDERQRENIHPELLDDRFRGERGDLRVPFESNGFSGGKQQDVAFAQEPHRGVFLQRFSRKLQPGERPSFRRGNPRPGGQRLFLARQDFAADPRQQVTIRAVEK